MFLLAIENLFKFRFLRLGNKKGANNHFAPQTQTIINQRNIIRMITFPNAKLSINYISASYRLKKINKFASVAVLRTNVSISPIYVSRRLYFQLYLQQQFGVYFRQANALDQHSKK